MAQRVYAADMGKYEGKKAVLMGWVNVRRDHGKLIFIDLRDYSGIAQCVFLSKDKNLFAKAEKLRSEWVVKITGKVKRRPKDLINPNLPSGQWEIAAEALEILAEADNLPIAIDTDGYEIGEENRLKYRFLDLRRSRLNNNLKIRHQAAQFIRNYLSQEGFIEVETPLLSKSTPEGARDFLVPSRIYPGKFFALPQSPQQYKQLLMVAGLEKYFQIARAFRDEDTRGDRQPEFTQIDIEASFIEQEDILTLVENLMVNLVKEVFPHKKIAQKPFPRLTYKEAMKRYKSDRPDLRKKEKEPAFAFIVDFPAFEWKERENRWDPVHHPFTQPNVQSAEELKKKFHKDPAAITARQYDLVLNGQEVGGGSIRISDPRLLQTVFELIGNKPKDIREKFGHLLDAFKFGVPPHGGIALGFDRLMSILLEEPNIREVIAFPKTGDMRDLMMGAPSAVDKAQLDELHLTIKKQKHGK